jgi:hypothetical protein
MPSTSQPEADNRRIPGEGDDCPVCYESMHGAPEKMLTFCDACGNALHSECWKQCAFFPRVTRLCGRRVLTLARDFRTHTFPQGRAQRSAV